MAQATFCRARAEDLPAIVAMLADDALGRAREAPDLPLDARYAVAFEAIDADANQLLLIAECNGVVAGCLQISFIPGLSRTGAWRALIESVRVSSALRGHGIGRQLVEFAIDEASRRGCRLVQLTTDRSRTDAHRFYERLGFVASHVGMKLELRGEAPLRG